MLGKKKFPPWFCLPRRHRFLKLAHLYICLLQSTKCWSFCTRVSEANITSKNNKTQQTKIRPKQPKLTPNHRSTWSKKKVPVASETSLEAKILVKRPLAIRIFSTVFQWCMVRLYLVHFQLKGTEWRMNEKNLKHCLRFMAAFRIRFSSRPLKSFCLHCPRRKSSLDLQKHVFTNQHKQKNKTAPTTTPNEKHNNSKKAGNRPCPLLLLKWY